MIVVNLRQSGIRLIFGIKLHVMRPLIHAIASVVVALLLAPSLVATPQKTVVVVNRSTVVAFFALVTSDEPNADADANEALADFKLYAMKVRKPLNDAGIDFKEVYSKSFQVQREKGITTFRPGKLDVGYYFVAPGKEPRIEYGVRTDADLLQIAKDYFNQASVPPPARNEAIPVFALLGSDRDNSVSIDPMLLIDGQQIRPVPNPCTETSALHDFENQYLKPGATYPVVFGGVQRGTASVTKLEGDEWRVRMDSDVPINADTMALAVGSSFLGGSSGVRRKPTAAEQKRIEQVARELLTSKGVPAKSLLRMRLTQVTATELNRSLKLIASVEVERSDNLGMEYSLFFVCDPVSDEKSVIWFQQPEGETDAEAVYLIDFLPAEHNGDRMFVRRVFYENYKYEVYRHGDGRWIREFASEVFGCL